MTRDKQKRFDSMASLLLGLLATVPTVSADCAKPPISIRLGDVSITDTQISRGLNISVGRPRQPFAFLPQWPLNDTFVYGTNGFCDNFTEAACTTYRGGKYNQFSSQDRTAAIPQSYLDGGEQYPDLNWITDTLTLNDNFDIFNFPVGVASDNRGGDQGHHQPQAGLGLGSNSTILGSLFSHGRIKSRSWGLFWGRPGEFESTQLDGNLVLGGYDRAKVKGENHTSPLAESTRTCATSMLVTITDVVLNFANDTDESLFGDDGSKNMAACIEPDAPVLMSIPHDPYFEKFQTLTGVSQFGRSSGIYYDGMIYNNDTEKYTGDLTIKLSSGLSIRIPNDQLVVPDLTIDEESGLLVSNHSRQNLLLNPLEGENAHDTLILGRQFLSSAYVMLNQDAQTFTLWVANATSNEDLVAVDRSNDVHEVCGLKRGPSDPVTVGIPIAFPVLIVVCAVLLPALFEDEPPRPHPSEK